MKNYWLLPVLFLLGMPSAQAAKANPVVATPRPGDVSNASGGDLIFLEGGRTLLWSSDGMVKIQEPGGASPLQVDLKTKPKKGSGSEAMGLDVEEADLGGRSGGKGYLQGKKDPKGRALDPSQVGSTPDATSQGQSQSQTVGGVKITQTKYPNGSYQMEFDWGKNSEAVFFDKRATMVWDELRGNAGSFSYQMRQWADGSFSRSYKAKGGEVDYNFDSLSSSYRLIFSNAAGEIVAEASCDGTCSLD